MPQAWHTWIRESDSSQLLSGLMECVAWQSGRTCLFKDSSQSQSSIFLAVFHLRKEHLSCLRSWACFPERSLCCSIYFSNDPNKHDAANTMTFLGHFSTSLENAWYRNCFRLKNLLRPQYNVTHGLKVLKMPFGKLWWYPNYQMIPVAFGGPSEWPLDRWSCPWLKPI